MNWDYIAGFYEGEGSCEAHCQTNRFVVSIIQTDKQILNRIQRFIGFGKVYPRRYKEKRHYKQSWLLRFYDREARLFADNILPRMQHPYKIKQLTKALRKST